MRLSRSALALALLGAALTSCGRVREHGRADATSTTTTDPIAARAPLRSCGQQPPEEANACLRDAWTRGEQAEVVITQSSVEGDPIVTYVRVLGPSSVEVLLDTRADHFGPQEVRRQMCRSLGFGPNGPEPQECRDEPYEPDPAPLTAQERRLAAANRRLLATLPPLVDRAPAERPVDRTGDRGGLRPVTRFTYELDVGTPRCPVVVAFEDELASRGWNVTTLETADVGGHGSMRNTVATKDDNRLELTASASSPHLSLYVDADAPDRGPNPGSRRPCTIDPT